jgi:hypothetical protein
MGVLGVLLKRLSGSFQSALSWLQAEVVALVSTLQGIVR